MTRNTSSKRADNEEEHNQLGTRWTDTNYVEDDEDDANDDDNGGKGWMRSLRNTNSNTASKYGEGFGEGFDVIFVEGEDGRLYENSDFLVSFKGEKDNGGFITDDDPNKIVVMEILPPPPVSQQQQQNDGNGDAAAADESCSKDKDKDNDKVWYQIQKGGTITDYDTAKQSSLQELRGVLRRGQNPIRYLLLDQSSKRVIGVAHASIYVWHYQDSIVVSDIDGTVTKSNMKGLFGTVATKLYNKVTHEGICHLLTTLAEQPSSSSSSSSSETGGTTHVLYLTSRPTLLANETRQLLVELKQEVKGKNDDEADTTTDVGLPAGPLLGFGGKVSKVIKMELLTHSANEFKAKKLWQQLVEPFHEAAAAAGDGNTNDDDTTNDKDQTSSSSSSSSSTYPTFRAAFGNNTRDMQAYHAIGMTLDQIYMIDKKSHLVTFDKKMEVDDDDDEKTPTTVNPTEENFQFRTENYYKERIGTEFENGYTDAKLHYRFGFYGHDDEKMARIAKYLKA